MFRLLHDRAARLRAEGEGGFALIFVLFVTTMVMIGTATTLAVTTGNILPTRHNRDAAAALAAAQAGVQRYVSMLNASCSPASIARCPALGAAEPAVAMQAVIGTQRYCVSLVNPGNQNGSGYLSATNRGTLFIRSTGTSPVPSTSACPTSTNPGTPSPPNTVSRTVTARLSGKPNPLSLAYFSDYETLGSSLLNSYFGPRQITLTQPPLGSARSSVLAAIGYPKAVSATVRWDGTTATPTTGAGDDICDKLWYDDPSNTANNTTSALGRSSLKAARTSLPVGTDYSETGTLQPLGGASSAYTRYAPCETTFTAGENFNGPVYSRDAFYLSKGAPNAVSAGPQFSVPSSEAYPALWTGWTTASIPSANSASPYRSFPVIGGDPAAGSGTVSTSPFSGLSLPNTLGITAGTCTFSGPTRITLSGSTAQVVSPLTTTPGSSCPATLAGGTWTVPVAVTTLYVTNSTSSTSLGFLNLPSGDITYYSPSAGDAYVSGTLMTGKLSIVADHDVVVTGNVLAGHPTAGDKLQPSVTDPASGEPAWKPGTAAIDLVGLVDVRVFHPVKCYTGSATYGANAASSPSATAQNGWCPNDITGLYSLKQSKRIVNPAGPLQDTHPANQYVNLAAGPAEIDAAVFALTGSFYTDNFDRGASLGTLTVSGGVYQNHHGPLGEEWETPTCHPTDPTNPSSTCVPSGRDNSGYRLQLNYLSYTNAGLGYVPELSGGTDRNPWQVVSVSSGGSS